MRMLSRKYKKCLLAVLLLAMEATSVALDLFGKSKLVVLIAAFIISALGFAITLYTCIRGRARSETEKQLKVVEVVFSLIQLVASFVHVVLTVLNKKNNYNLSIFFPLAFTLTAAVFVFKGDGTDDCMPEELPIISKNDGKRNDSTPADLLDDNGEILVDKSKQERRSVRKRFKIASDKVLDNQAFVQDLLEKLGSRELLEILRQEGLHSKIKKCEQMLLLIEAVIIDAEEKQVIKWNVGKWLDELRYLAYDVDKMLKQFAHKTFGRKLRMEEHQASTGKLWRLIPAFLTRLSPTALKTRLGPTALKCNCGVCSKIDDITSRLEDLCQKIIELGLEKISGERSNHSWQRSPSTSLRTEPVVYGRDEEKAKLLELVLRDEPSHANFEVIAIVDMGGMGKTTLVRTVYNDEAVEDFSLKAWISISDNSDDLGILTQILESITPPSCEIEELSEIQIQLKEAFSGKRFLVVLDDVWTMNDGLWEVLRSSFMSGSPGSRLIVTTRIMQVAHTLENSVILRLDPLSESDCWSILVQHAFGSRDLVHPSLEVILSELVQRCRWLPLAIKILGGLLCFKQTENEWMDILNSKIWDLDTGYSILPVLRISYYYLPLYLKRCFIYCATFPRNYEFEEKEVVDLWLSNGLIQPLADNKNLEDLAGEYFRDLVSLSYFQLLSPITSKFIIHDLVYDLAQYFGRQMFQHSTGR